MRSGAEWIGLLKQLENAMPIGDLLALVRAAPDVLGVLLVYALAFAWLCWWIKHRRSRQGPVRLLSALVLLAVGLLLALARAEGRSTFYSGTRL